MKPCLLHRRSLALLAAGTLPTKERAQVEEHLDACPACRAYHDQIASLCREHSREAASLPSAELPIQVYDRVAREIRRSTPRLSPRAPNRSRVWLPRMAAAALVLLASLAGWKLTRSGIPVVSSPAERSLPPITQSMPAPNESEDSLGFYRKTVVRSLDDLDRLVTQQAGRVEGFASSSRLNRGLLD